MRRSSWRCWRRAETTDVRSQEGPKDGSGSAGAGGGAASFGAIGVAAASTRGAGAAIALARGGGGAGGDLESAITCAAEGHTLKVTPGPAGNAVASVELTSDGAVVQRAPYYSVLKDVLGHRFVVGAWEGVRISLGEDAARFENEVTGLALDFPAGSCATGER